MNIKKNKRDPSRLCQKGYFLLVTVAVKGYIYDKILRFSLPEVTCRLFLIGRQIERYGTWFREILEKQFHHHAFTRQTTKQSQ
jgi:ABC-type transport system involved in cytochrome bd biosynthesis fused ATPase/permease subunit